jgi:eukaryotic-like serine/threonine-protein kinase
MAEHGAPHDPGSSQHVRPASRDGETLAASSSQPIGSPGSGERLAREVLSDRYEILGFIGAGGMGTVYRAHDRELDEVIALKVLRRELVNAPGIIDRFRREVKLARRVTHVNVARMFDICSDGEERFLTMEFVDGESLSAALARDGRPALARAVDMASAICAGLASAHAAGVVHRDLKPDNVLLGRDGRVVLTDFGIARAAADVSSAVHTGGMLVGTPAYMAPEQVEGRDDIDARADVYAFGALLFELATGVRPWPGELPFAVAAARLVNPPPDPRAIVRELPDSIVDLVLRCLARSRDERPPSIELVARDLATLTFPPEARIAALSAPPTLVAPPVLASNDKTVAVLPFRNAGDPEDEYLAVELTDDLIDALSMTRGLRVTSRGVVGRFRGKDADPREMGRDLGVQVVVEGSVRKRRGNIRVSARVVTVADGFQIWATRIDRPESEVLRVNDEVAQAIAAALLLENGGAARASPSDARAVDLYLRARHEYRKFWPEFQERARVLFAEALAIAPNDPTIIAGHAMALTRMAFYFGDAYLGAARAAGERAVIVAPSYGEARLALGSVLLQVGDVLGAVRELKHALVLQPGLAEAQAALGRILLEVGPMDEAMRRLEAALALDPYVPLARDALARGFVFRGEWDRADEVLGAIHDEDERATAVSSRARLALWRGDPSQAQALAAEAGASSQLRTMAQRLTQLAQRRDAAKGSREARAEADTAGGSVRMRVFFLQMIAEAFAQSGDRERAVEAIAAVVDGGLLDLVWIERCPLFAAWRSEAPMPALTARVAERAAPIRAAIRAGANP